jgi:hypothetical protein
MRQQHLNVISTFPKIKLSYESFLHKKVLDANIVLAIPAGKKCFAWFTTKDEKNVCYILELGKDYKQIEQVHLTNACFHHSLSLGTIFYGTMFFYEKRRFFTIEDVMYYKGNHVHSLGYSQKLQLYDKIFSKDINQLSVASSFIVFGLPLMSDNIDDLLSRIHPKQRIQYFIYRYTNKNTIYRVKPYIVMRNDDSDEELTQPIINTKTQPVKPITHTNHTRRINNGPILHKIFQVNPDIQNDIYHLYDIHNNDYIDIAYIPDYTTSVMMNKIFRNIKENDNLDALEESDSEEEFEDERIDKYVHLDKKMNMNCAYNYKFKKWVPLSIVN